MDEVHDKVNAILTKVTASKLSDVEKADIMAEFSVGMRRLVWPILLSHVPEYLLKEAAGRDAMSLDEYLEIIESAVGNPATAKEIHDELTGALAEIELLVTKALG